MISIVGPGTGLGVAALLRKRGPVTRSSRPRAATSTSRRSTASRTRSSTELRRNFRRVSVERIASGRGLWNLYEALGAIDGRDLTFHDDKELWAAALDGSDSLAIAALDRFCLTLGAVAGDMALAQGAIGGGDRRRRRACGSPTICRSRASATGSSPRAGSNGGWTRCRSG